MDLEEPVWNHSTFSANRERLFSEAMTQRFFAQLLRIAEWQSLFSDEHFTVDGTMIEAWASRRICVSGDGPRRGARLFQRPVRSDRKELRRAIFRFIHRNCRSHCADVSYSMSIFRMESHMF